MCQTSKHNLNKTYALNNILKKKHGLIANKMYSLRMVKSCGVNVSNIYGNRWSKIEFFEHN